MENASIKGKLILVPKTQAARYETNYNIITCTCYSTSAVVIHESISCFETTTIAITVLTYGITTERGASALTSTASVSTCALVTIITGHAFTI